MRNKRICLREAAEEVQEEEDIQGGLGLVVETIMIHIIIRRNMEIMIILVGLKGSRGLDSMGVLVGWLPVGEIENRNIENIEEVWE